MRAELKAIHREIGVTAVYVTHDQAEAMTLSDRIAVMAEGRILQVGTPRALYEEPADVRVARFIGRANLFDALIVAQGAAGASVRIEGIEQVLSCRAPRDLPPNIRGSLSVRPEAVSLRRSPGNGAALSGRIASATYLGNLSQFEVALDSGRLIEVQQTTSDTWSVGDAVSVSFDPERSFFIAGSPLQARFPT
jgi:ABC-type Fe3+/spermidine/putrescine transport system ATPase subunit